ncbi:chymotrypsin-2-like [Ctenocephalides felis]|uniref:chymotrypsin-2-like n=1 Tax=Ctenocephalides felis TaxID=7515 RepID=UPI000E6E3A45|nr:chymotrypsin-2-like [Ctenocephalides felis]
MKTFIVLLATICFVSANPAGRIVGGENADDASAPYQVSLQFKNFHFCGGSILNKYWIITAAHCMGRRFEVVVGINRLDQEGYRYQVAEIVTLPFDSETNNYDLALVKVKKPIKFNYRVQPIPLGEEYVEGGEEARLTGWGRLGADDPAPNELQELNTFTISHKICKKAHQHVVYPSQICAFVEKGKGACMGDSGGPLVVNGELHGVVSGESPAPLENLTSSPESHTMPNGSREDRR